MSVDTFQNYKKLTELIPELEDLVNTGIIIAECAEYLVLDISTVNDFWANFAFMKYGWGIGRVEE